MMGSYLSLRNIVPDHIVSSCSLRAQQTAEALAEKIGYQGSIEYMSELYLGSSDTVLNVLANQEDCHQSLFFIGHNPVVNEIVKQWIDEGFTKFPTLGIMALQFDIERWQELREVRNSAKIDFFVFPKQFRYYLPLEIKKILK